MSLKRRTGTILLPNEEVKKINEFTYLGSSQGQWRLWVWSYEDSTGLLVWMEKSVRSRHWMGWNDTHRTESEGLLDSHAPAIRYGLEIVALTERLDVALGVAEIKMPSLSMGVTGLDKIRHKYIKIKIQVTFGRKERESRLRRSEHV